METAAYFIAGSFLIVLAVGWLNLMYWLALGTEEQGMRSILTKAILIVLGTFGWISLIILGIAFLTEA